MKARSNNISRIVIVVFSLLGLALSLYLAYIYSTPSAQSYCGPDSGCDAVRLSTYSSLLGLAVPVWGIMGYSFLLALSFIPLSKRRRWLGLYFVSLVGVTFSAYLTYVELVVLKTVCPFCVASAVFILIIFVAIVLAKPKSYTPSPVAIVFLSLIVLLAIPYGTHMVQSENLQSTAPESRAVRLAKHLTATGATMYGTYWCPHCKAQKKLFGDAFKYVTYVDCDPGAPRNSNPALCKAKGIRKYPTWIISGRRYLGVQPLSELEYLSGFNIQRKRGP